MTIAPIDPAGATALQQWCYGSDQRLYLNTPGPPVCLDFVNQVTNGTPLQVSPVVPGDQTQQWQWNGTSHTSTFANVGATGFVIDNAYGGTGPGNKVQIWSSLGNANQFFALTFIPKFTKSQ